MGVSRPHDVARLIKSTSKLTLRVSFGFPTLWNWLAWAMRERRDTKIAGRGSRVTETDSDKPRGGLGGRCLDRDPLVQFTMPCVTDMKTSSSDGSRSAKQ